MGGERRLVDVGLRALLDVSGLTGKTIDSYHIAFMLAPRVNAAATYTRSNVRNDQRHNTFVELAKKGDIDILFHGDSITDWWQQAGAQGGKEVFEKYFGGQKIANFAIAGDTTQGLLWGLKNGEGEGFSPKAIMLMIGTNNSNGKDNTSDEIAEGIEAIVKEIHKRSPKTKVLLLAVFPRATVKDKDAQAAQTAKINAINDRIAKLDDGGKTVKYLDIGKKFLATDGSIPKEIMPDQLHLSPKGYRIWADAVAPTLKELMGS